MLTHEHRIGDKIRLKSLHISITIDWNKTNTTSRMAFVALIRWSKPEGGGYPTESNIWDTSAPGWWHNPMRVEEHLKDYKVMRLKSMNYADNVTPGISKLRWNIPLKALVKYPAATSSANPENVSYHLFMLFDSINDTNYDIVHLVEKFKFYP